MICDIVREKKGLAWPCGECEPCLVNRRRQMLARLILEQTQHSESSFITLTYRKETLPASGTWDLETMPLFLKRLRSRLGPKRPVRYYAVVEYGEHTKRLHYHLILFGIGRAYQHLIESCWNLGFVQVGDATKESMEYVAGYVMKKMFRKDSGTYRERSWQSKGLGKLAIPNLVKAQYSPRLIQEMHETGDVISEFSQNRKKYPLGRYLRGKLREEVTGFAKGSELQEVSPMLRMSNSAKALAKYVFEKSPQYLEEQIQKRRALSARLKQNKSRRNKI